MKLIVWGGWWKADTPVQAGNINSHASVTAYFLTKYLRRYFDVVNVYDFYKVRRILSHNDAYACLSTFQTGFTRLPEKGMKDVYGEIRRRFRGKLCSVADGAYRARYLEDILFTVRPPRWNAARLASRIFGGHTEVVRMGWPADTDVAYPEPVEKGKVNIFVDHSWYTGGADCSKEYFYALKEIKRRSPGYDIDVYRQNNEGVVKWDLDREYSEPLFIRARKVPHELMLEFYRKCHLFCVTHPESAGLAAIEAAMCGARLVVPRSARRHYISKDLLEDGVSYVTTGLSAVSIRRTIEREIERGIEREANRKPLLKNNTWAVAAMNVSRAIKGS